EPEPWCLLETTGDCVAFFRDWLFSAAAVRRVAGLAALTESAAAAMLRRHLGLCLDVCHMAVAFETPEATLASLAAAEIPIHKIQLSAALRIDRMTATARQRVAGFQDRIYLHQVVARSQDGTLRRVLDLPEALAAEPADEEEEWRVHFHVPVFAELAPPLASTRDVLERVLALHRAQPICRHLEVETYTWDVLPVEAGFGPELSVVDGIERELRWVLRQLA
ncbi:MAG: hypothetical protein WCC64_17865, partial [Aliidongia sp.]